MGNRELKFAVVISTTHFAQHFLMRLIPPLIPVLSVVLDYPLWQLGLLVSLFFFGSGLAQAPLGILSDRYDRLYLLPTGIAIAGVSYLVFAVAPTIGSVIPAVILGGYTFEGGFLVMSLAMLGVGLGTAVVHPTGYPLISANVSAENKGKVLGAFGSSSKLGDAAAPAIIGVLILLLVWEQIIVLFGVGGIVLGIGLYLLLRGETFETRPIGTRASSEQAESATRSSSSDDNRTYLYPLVVIYVFFISKMFAANGLNTFIPAFVVGVYAYSLTVGDVLIGPESVANVYFALLLFSGALSQLVFGVITDRYDKRTVIISCMAVATVALIVLAVADLSPILLLLVVLVLGPGLWGLNPTRDALISDITPPEREGRTFGYIWTTVLLTGSLIPVSVGYVIDLLGFREAFLLLAAGPVVAAGAISLLYFDRVYVSGGSTSAPEEASSTD